MNHKNIKESVKDGSRQSVFGAVSIIISYFLPFPPEVTLAITVVLLAVLTYADSAIHRSDSKLNGLWPW